MRSEQELRLECLKLAASLVNCKALQPAQTVAYAMVFHRWVVNDPDDKADLSPLKEKWSR